MLPFQLTLSVCFIIFDSDNKIKITCASFGIDATTRPWKSLNFVQKSTSLATLQAPLLQLGLRYAVNLHPASNDVKQYIEDQFYVDDGLASADTIEQATSVLKETVETLSRCNIRLHKFMSSSQEVVMAFPESETCG